MSGGIAAASLLLTDTAVADVYPAILATDVHELTAKVRQAESFAPFLHIDIADGTYVPTRTVTADALIRVAPAVPFELHLMVQSPGGVLDQWLATEPYRILFHPEADENARGTLQRIRDARKEAGVVLTQRTANHDCASYNGLLNQITLLTVVAGYQGGGLEWALLEHAARIAALYGVPIEVDGGINERTIEGVMTLCHPGRLTSGSAIWQATNAAAMYQTLAEAASHVVS